MVLEKRRIKFRLLIKRGFSELFQTNRRPIIARNVIAQILHNYSAEILFAVDNCSSLHSRSKFLSVCECELN